jgi:tetraacyldisaccharide 4'-kinase
MLGYLYAQVAAARRRSSTAPGRQRRLARPVVSVGNLRVGGSGKTPAVAHLAALMLADGERPAILTRGYARQHPQPGVVIVSDGREVLGRLAESGDEPLMLARDVPGASVLVSPDRYEAGRVAETRLGATVHLLDDGFQHLRLARGTDLLIVSPDDVRDPRTLPFGRLRESLDAARAADALLVAGATETEAAEVAGRLGVPRCFRLTRASGGARWLQAPDGGGDADAFLSASPVMAVAAIARPERFFSDLRARGLEVAGTTAFADHHAFRPSDLRALADTARRHGAAALVTTAKDAVRLEPFLPLPMPVAWIPLSVRVEPPEDFGPWLRARLSSERARETDVPS